MAMVPITCHYTIIQINGELISIENIVKVYGELPLIPLAKSLLLF
jgi:hypothetical protein